MMRTAGNPTAWGKDDVLHVGTHDVRGKAVVYIKAGPTGAGGGADDKLSFSGDGSYPSYILSVKRGA